MKVIRTWFKCICGCSWYSDTDEGAICPECSSFEWKIIDEEDVTEFYKPNQQTEKG